MCEANAYLRKAGTEDTVLLEMVDSTIARRLFAISSSFITRANSRTHIIPIIYY